MFEKYKWAYQRSFTGRSGENNSLKSTIMAGKGGHVERKKSFFGGGRFFSAKRGKPIALDAHLTTHGYFCRQERLRLSSARFNREKLKIVPEHCYKREVVIRIIEEAPPVFKTCRKMYANTNQRLRQLKVSDEPFPSGIILGGTNQPTATQRQSTPWAAVNCAATSQHHDPNRQLSIPSSCS